MRIDLVTLFPAMFAGVFGSSIIGRAVQRGIIDIHYTDFRDYAIIMWTIRRAAAGQEWC